jgi:hypothetical protein
VLLKTAIQRFGQHFDCLQILLDRNRPHLTSGEAKSVVPPPDHLTPMSRAGFQMVPTVCSDQSRNHTRAVLGGVGMASVRDWRDCSSSNNTVAVKTKHTLLFEDKTKAKLQLMATGSLSLHFCRRLHHSLSV